MITTKTGNLAGRNVNKQSVLLLSYDKTLRPAECPNSATVALIVPPVRRYDFVAGVHLYRADLERLAVPIKEIIMKFLVSIIAALCFLVGSSTVEAQYPQYNYSSVRGWVRGAGDTATRRG